MAAESLQHKPMSGTAVKRVAMRLRGLTEADRSWLLGNLNARQRRQVEAAEEELRTILGTRQIDFSLFLDSLTGPRGDNTQLARHGINGADNRQLEALLNQLPTAWIKALLDSGIWHEGYLYKERLPAKQRQQLDSCQSGPIPPRVIEAFADSVTELVMEKNSVHG